MRSFCAIKKRSGTSPGSSTRGPHDLPQGGVGGGLCKQDQDGVERRTKDPSRRETQAVQKNGATGGGKGKGEAEK